MGLRAPWILGPACILSTALTIMNSDVLGSAHLCSGLLPTASKDSHKSAHEGRHLGLRWPESSDSCVAVNAAKLLADTDIGDANAARPSRERTGVEVELEYVRRAL
jgi:hypothetical protein